MDNISIYQQELYRLIKECINHNEQVCGKKASNNTVRYYKQCLCCGYSDKIQVKKPEIPNEKFNSDLYQIFNKKLSSTVSDLQFQSYKTQQENRKNEWLKEYSVYLQSPKWLIKRKKVLERDNHICQACLTRKATQVHHTTYRHVGDEPLFELVSVCKECHDKITELDN